MIGITLAFLLGALVSGPAWVLVGAIIADSLHAQRARRRRRHIDIYGADAVESWLETIELPPRPTNGNGTPFEEDAAA